MKTNTAIIESNGRVFILRIDDAIVEEIEDVKENLRVLESLVNQPSEIQLIICPGKDSGITKEAREYVTQRMNSYQAVAFVSTSLAQRIIVNYVARLLGIKTKARVLTSEYEAISWIKQVTNKLEFAI